MDIIKHLMLALIRIEQNLNINPLYRSNITLLRIIFLKFLLNIAELHEIQISDPLLSLLLELCLLDFFAKNQAFLSLSIRAICVLLLFLKFHWILVSLGLGNFLREKIILFSYFFLCNVKFVEIYLFIFLKF
jgi:hypothetical protein